MQEKAMDVHPLSNIYHKNRQILVLTEEKTSLYIVRSTPYICTPVVVTRSRNG